MQVVEVAAIPVLPTRSEGVYVLNILQADSGVRNQLADAMALWATGKSFRVVEQGLAQGLGVVERPSCLDIVESLLSSGITGKRTVC